jgi:hypothetical protein
MSKGQRGNKEAKKPKKVPVPPKPVTPEGLPVAAGTASPPRVKK